jgi:lipopolysaccharide heptosyltransferase II
MSKRVLINFPTNIGDVILALPVLDRIKSILPDSIVTAIVSLRSQDFLAHNSFIDQSILFNKRWSASEKLRFCRMIAGKYEVAVDFKNTAIPFISGAKWRTPVIRRFASTDHITDKYLSLIKDLGEEKEKRRSDFLVTPADQARLNALLNRPAIFLACSSRSLLKQYPYEYLSRLVKLLNQKRFIAIVGESAEREFFKDILTYNNVIDLVGKTSISDVFYLLKNYALVVAGGDSSIVHMSSYLNLPTVALFGATTISRSQPRSDLSAVLVNEQVDCVPCEKAFCYSGYECMKIDPGKIVAAINFLLNQSHE